MSLRWRLDYRGAGIFEQIFRHMNAVGRAFLNLRGLNGIVISENVNGGYDFEMADGQTRKPFNGEVRNMGKMYYGLNSDSSKLYVKVPRAGGAPIETDGPIPSEDATYDWFAKESAANDGRIYN